MIGSIPRRKVCFFLWQVFWYYQITSWEQSNLWERINHTTHKFNPNFILSAETVESGIMVILTDTCPSWSWSYVSWIYNFLCNQCISLWVWMPLMVKCTQYNIMWSTLSVTCGRSVFFFGYSGFLHQLNWPPRYSWNIFESGVKHHNPNP
jgi:hypothetical protein